MTSREQDRTPGSAGNAQPPDRDLRDRDTPGVEQGGRRGGDLAPGTAPEQPPPEGTSVDAPAVQGIHRPDMGPGGADLDEDDRVLPNRARTARRPDQPSAPGSEPPLRRTH